MNDIANIRRRVDRRRAARLALVGLAVVLALRSVAVGLPDTWRQLNAAHDRYARLSGAQRAAMPIAVAHLPPALFAFYAAHVHRGDRYYLELVDHGHRNAERANRVRLLAALELLPATAVDDPARATVVLAWHRAPAELGLRYSALDRLAGLDATAARVTA